MTNNNEKMESINGLKDQWIFDSGYTSIILNSIDVFKTLINSMRQLNMERNIPNHTLIYNDH